MKDSIKNIDRYAGALYKARHRIKQRMKDIMPLHDNKSLYFYRGLELALIIINECIEEESE